MSGSDLYYPNLTTYTFPAAAASSGAITIPQADSLTVVVFSTGLTLSGTGQLVFNSDTGANYVNTLIDVATASTTPANTASVSQAAAVFSLATTTPFFAVFKIANFASATKPYTYRIIVSGTNPDNCFGGGEWVNTTSPITTITLNASAGNYGAGSYVMVYGYQF